jgi:uncharacterized membrane protein
MPDDLERSTSTPGELPFAAPCRVLDTLAPLRWVGRGWSDFRRAPGLSLAIGALIVLLSLAIVAIGWFYGGYWVEIALLSGFIFVGPVVAVLFYAVSWQLENRQVPGVRDCVARVRASLGNLMVFTLVLMIVFLLWGRSATAVHIFFPFEGRPALAQMLPFLAIGSLIGSVFALIVFTFSAFAMPMIMDRRIDAVTAVVTSVNAVLRNKPAMAVWVVLIVSGIAIGFATAMVGLAVTMPVLGYATWHGYRETIDATLYPPADPKA